jgi:hypothetical protein
MNGAKAALVAGLLLLATDGWGQQNAAPASPEAQLRALRQQVTALRKQLAAARNDLAAQNGALQELQAQVRALQSQQAELSALRQQAELVRAELRSLKANTVLDLNGYVTFEIANGYPTALFRGVNVQIVNGTGDTQSVNGMGNLIVGYNRPGNGSFTCSLGSAATEPECTAGGGLWAQSHKTGSHNIVGGDFNSYSSWGGLVLGFENTLSAPYAAVIAGARNRASASFASISGGSYNTASGIYSAVSGGFSNRAVGDFSGVGGGSNRTAPSAHDWAAGALTQDK